MNRIKEVLDEKGIKQTWLAEKLGKELQYGQFTYVKTNDKRNSNRRKA